MFHRIWRSLSEALNKLLGRVGTEESAARRQERQEKNMREEDFTLDDFRKQFEQLKKVGLMRDALSALPGMRDMIPEGEDPEQAFRRIQGMIDAMTDEERRNPNIIDDACRLRIAAASGTELWRGQRVRRPVRAGPHSDTADGQDEHVAAHPHGHWAGHYGAPSCPVGLTSSPSDGRERLGPSPVFDGLGRPAVGRFPRYPLHRTAKPLIIGGLPPGRDARSVLAPRRRVGGPCASERLCLKASSAASPRP